MKKIICCLCLLSVLLCQPARAVNIPYRTYAMGSAGSLVETQTAYEPIRVLTRFGGEKLKTPNDLFYGPNGHLYIADSGNKRILEILPDGDAVRSYGNKKTLKEPTGVFVDAELNVYVADKGLRSVVVFSPEGDVIGSYGRPDHPMFGEKATFSPIKLVLDARGNMYILSQGNTNGVVQLSLASDGEFIGYFGANVSAVSFSTMIKRLIYHRSQLENINIVPVSLTNIAIDGEGMIYTVSAKEGKEFLRRLNVAGTNTLSPEWHTTSTKAVAVHPASGNIYTANINGEFMEFSAEGKLLFKFNAYDGGEPRNGTFRSVTAIAVDESYTLYALDEILGSVTIFKPTGFADYVHQALQYFQAGRYEESKEPWMNVLHMNSLFTCANVGLGDVLYRENDYQGALRYYRNGGDRQGYSDAYWQIRSDWLHRYLFIFIVAGAGLWIIERIVQIADRKRGILAPVHALSGRILRIPIVAQLKYSLYILRNPYDACYGIKREGKAGYLPAALILLLFFAGYVANKYCSGFLFSAAEEGLYELPFDACIVFGVFLLVVISLYLVSSIKEGEAHFRDLLISCAYSLLPMVFFYAARLVLTNVLTYNEQFFIALLSVVCFGWTALLAVLSVMFMNDYSFRKTLWVILLSLFNALVIAALLFVIYTLCVQLYGFLASIAGEVVYRFVRTN